MRTVVFIAAIFLSNLLWGQADSIKLVKYTPGFRFHDGLYLTHDQLLNNAPISIKRIVSNYNKAGFDFFDKLLADEYVSYYDQFGIKKDVKVSNLWGFCRRGSVYINWGDDFNRISVIGSACHFIATVTIADERYNNSPYGYGYGYGYYNVPTNSTHSEIYQYIMVFSLGKILEYTIENIEILLMADTELYDEYKALSKKKKNEMKFLYLRKFNEKHPLYIPIN